MTRPSLPYPWQTNQWQACVQRIQQGLFPHATLLCGDWESGTNDIATHLAHALLCQSTEDIPCKACYPCHLLDTQNHPDLLVLGPEKPDTTIKIESIRALIQFLSIKSYYGRGRVVLIRNANRMTFQAQNSLLKILEEPPEHKLIILQSNRVSSLLPTINSRCQKYYFNQPSPAEVVAWFSQHTALDSTVVQELLDSYWLARPLAALPLLQEKGDQATLPRCSDLRQDCQQFTQRKLQLKQLVERWKNISAQQLHDWLLEIARQEVLNSLRERQPLLAQQLFTFYNLQIKRYRQVDSQLNPQLMLESAVLELRALQSQNRSRQNRSRRG